MYGRFSLCMVALTVLLWVISPAMAAGKPNIIVIFTDDQGYADVACQGVLDDLKTPNLDRLAADGVRCTNGYVTAPQCIPSRAGILTGCYQQRFGVDHNGGIPLPLEVTTIPQRLGEAGYVTGQVGKWHLEPNWQETEWVREHMPEVKPGEKPSIPGKLARPYLPDKRGFNEMFCGYINQYLASYNLDGKDVSPPKNIKTPGYRLDTQTDAALAFIDRHADKPFFLYLAYFAPHVPLDATDKYLQRFPENMPRRRRLALAMIAAIDEGVGRLRDSLRQHGLTDNTLIFFISDNGAPLKIDMKDEPGVGPGWDGSRNDPLVGEKGMLTEGGIRVPFFVTWPGTIPAGKTYDQPVISLDVGATAVALAGLDKPAELDGVNILPYLKGENTLPPHETLYWRFWQQTAVRKGQWKYLQAGADLQYLFDLTSPEQEHKNLIHEHPEIAAELRASLKTWAHPLKNPGVPVGPLSPAEVKWFDVYLPH